MGFNFDAALAFCVSFDRSLTRQSRNQTGSAAHHWLRHRSLTVAAR